MGFLWAPGCETPVTPVLANFFGDGYDYWTEVMHTYLSGSHSLFLKSVKVKTTSVFRIQ